MSRNYVIILTEEQFGDVRNVVQHHVLPLLRTRAENPAEREFCEKRIKQYENLQRVFETVLAGDRSQDAEPDDEEPEED